MVKVNIFGFDRNNYVYGKTYRCCPIHPGSRLLPVPEDKSLLQCQSCGSRYPIKDTVPEEEIHTMFGPSSNSTKIIQGKKKKKQIADDGNEVLDNDLLPYHVISYNEYKTGEPDKPVVVKR